MILDLSFLNFISKNSEIDYYLIEGQCNEPYIIRLPHEVIDMQNNCWIIFDELTIPKILKIFEIKIDSNMPINKSFAPPFQLGLTMGSVKKFEPIKDDILKQFFSISYVGEHTFSSVQDAIYRITKEKNN